MDHVDVGPCGCVLLRNYLKNSLREAEGRLQSLISCSLIPKNRNGGAGGDGGGGGVLMGNIYHRHMELKPIFTQDG